jgi:hypothetical protein
MSAHSVVRIAVVGSREYPNMPLVRDTIRLLPRSAVVVSGAARGVDRTAADAAREYGLAVTEYPANWNAYGKTAGFIRNQQIVDDADCLIAFWDGKSNGTAHSVNLARKKGIPYFICLPKTKAFHHGKRLVEEVMGVERV